MSSSAKAPRTGRAVTHKAPETVGGQAGRQPLELPLDLLRSLGWLRIATLVLAILGLVDSAYQTYTDYAHVGLLGCSAKADACVVVQHSSYAYVFGIPVAALGVAFYVFMVAICSPWAWRSKVAAVRLARVASMVIGMFFVLYLVYAEVVRLGRICPYCTSVHIITFLLFSLIIFDAAGTKPVRPNLS